MPGASLACQWPHASAADQGPGRRRCCMCPDRHWPGSRRRRGSLRLPTVPATPTDPGPTQGRYGESDPAGSRDHHDSTSILNLNQGQVLSWCHREATTVGLGTAPRAQLRPATARLALSLPVGRARSAPPAEVRVRVTQPRSRDDPWELPRLGRCSSGGYGGRVHGVQTDSAPFACTFCASRREHPHDQMRIKNDRR